MNRLNFTRRGVTLIPTGLAAHTRKAVSRFGLFLLVWPLAVLYWTDHGVFDIWALFIATNGRWVTTASFKRFPWTAVLCCIYPLAFVASLHESDAADLWNWLPTRSSPVLALQLASAVWAVYCIYLISRCHLSHHRSSRTDNLGVAPE